MGYVRYVCSVTLVAAITLVATAVSMATRPSSNGESLLKQIVEARKEVRHWQKVMHRERSVPKVRGSELRTASTAFKERALVHWSRRVRRARAKAADPPHEREFRCIKRHEGPWDANTGNGYYGGLQMDVTFQRSYGNRLFRVKGLAHRWTPIEQIWVGEHAVHEGRGFHPWPTSARRCGLI